MLGRKPMVDFLLAVMELFASRFTAFFAEQLLAHIGAITAFRMRVSHFHVRFHMGAGGGRPPVSCPGHSFVTSIARIVDTIQLISLSIVQGCNAKE